MEFITSLNARPRATSIMKVEDMDIDFIPFSVGTKILRRTFDLSLREAVNLLNANWKREASLAAELAAERGERLIHCIPVDDFGKFLAAMRESRS